MIKQLYDDKIEVTLSSDEEEIARLVGKLRNDRAEALGRDPEYNLPHAEGDMPQELLHQHGAGGEEATAKGLGIYVDSFGQQYEDDSDLGGIQVRCRTQHDYELYLFNKAKDRTDVPWVLTTGVLPGPYTIHGWIMGWQAKQPMYWLPATATSWNRRDCFCPPTDHLSQDWDALRKWHNENRKFHIVGS